MNINKTARGFLWIVLSGFVFVVFIVLVRLAGTRLHPVQAAFLRYGISLILLMPVVYRYGLSIFYTRSPGRQIARGVIHALGVLLWFYAITVMPIAEATALSYTTPIFVMIGAVLFLGERLTLGKTLALVSGFMGVMVILRPDAGTLGFGAAALLLAAPLFAASNLLVKSLVRNDSATTTVVYLSLFAALTMSIPAYLVWQTPTAFDLLLLSGAAAFATLSHLCMAQGLKLVDVSVVQPAEYLRLVWSVLFGLILFDEIPSAWVWIGSAVVILSATAGAHTELRCSGKTHQ